MTLRGASSVVQKQSDLVYKLRDDLQKNLSKKELQELLEFNEIDIPAGESRVSDGWPSWCVLGTIKV